MDFAALDGLMLTALLFVDEVVNVDGLDSIQTKPSGCSRFYEYRWKDDSGTILSQNFNC